MKPPHSCGSCRNEPLLVGAGPPVAEGRGVLTVATTCCEWSTAEHPALESVQRGRRPRGRSRQQRLSYSDRDRGIARGSTTGARVRPCPTAPPRTESDNLWVRRPRLL